MHCPSRTITWTYQQGLEPSRRALAHNPCRTQGPSPLSLGAVKNARDAVALRAGTRPIGMGEALFKEAWRARALGG